MRPTLKIGNITYLADWEFLLNLSKKKLMNLLKQKKSTDFKNSFNDLYAIKLGLDNCIFIDDNLIEKTNFSLPLTNLGTRLFKYLKKKHPNVSDSLVYLAIFIDFYHNDIYFNVLEVNINEIQNFISDWIIKEQIKFPWIYGRDLYDKYYNEFITQEAELSFEETLAFLEKTKKGVFQINSIIFSPFGILKSKVNRDVFPRTNIYLWHCPDPSCPAFHKTKLNNSEENKLVKLSRDIVSFNSTKNPCNIDDILLDTSLDDYFEPNSLKGLFEIIVNAFGTEEHKCILQRIIEKEDIRDMLPAKLQKGSAKDIVKALNKNECFSLILIYDDNTILKHTEKLIEEGVILIPSTEIRQSILNEEFGHYDTFIQCNKLGFRVNSHDRYISLAKLKKFLKDINNESPYREQLEWKLRKYAPSLSLDQKLSKYLVDETPIKIIQETIFNGEAQLEKAFKVLPGVFYVPNNQEEEKLLVDKIAWKLGFNINLYPSYIENFWKNLAAFKTDILSSVKYNENDKSKIRSSAVNLFVSIEEILQQSLSFITWVLLSDHYLITKFNYVYEDAREFMISKLNDFEYTPGEFLKFDKAGKNTLFPLVSGFGALIKMCDNLIDNCSKYRRPKNQFPGFYQKDPLKLFPFEHQIFILDIKNFDYEKIKETINIVPSEFGKGNVIDIRNRLQHKREDFPIQEEMLNAVNSIEKSFALLENEGIYPNVYLFKNSVTDEYSRTRLSLTNYKGNEINFFITPELDGTNLPSPFNPIVVIKNVLVGLTDHPIMFKYQEKSSYQSYWKGYPRKKSKD